jgi:hypothetical protein
MNRPLLAFLIVGAVLIAARCLAGCGALTPAEQAGVAGDGIMLSACAGMAHGCKHDQADGNFAPCWDEYDRCMVAHGFADAGRTLAFGNDNGHPDAGKDGS